MFSKNNATLVWLNKIPMCVLGGHIYLVCVWGEGSSSIFAVVRL